MCVLLTYFLTLQQNRENVCTLWTDVTRSGRCPSSVGHIIHVDLSAVVDVDRQRILSLQLFDQPLSLPVDGHPRRFRRVDSPASTCRGVLLGTARRRQAVAGARHWLRLSINQSINIRLLRHDKTHANNVKRKNANNIQIIIYKK